jgi:hypothetical protein
MDPPQPQSKTVRNTERIVLSLKTNASMFLRKKKRSRSPQKKEAPAAMKPTEHKKKEAALQEEERRRRERDRGGQAGFHRLAPAHRLQRRRKSL